MHDVNTLVALNRSFNFVECYTQNKSTPHYIYLFL